MPFGVHNQIAEALSDALPDWVIESESDCVARAYNLDPRNDPDKRQLATIEVRTDYDGNPISVTSSAYSELREMGDLHHDESCETLDVAKDAARRLAREVVEETQAVEPKHSA